MTGRGKESRTSLSPSGLDAEADAEAVEAEGPDAAGAQMAGQFAGELADHVGVIGVEVGDPVVLVLPERVGLAPASLPAVTDAAPEPVAMTAELSWSRSREAVADVEEAVVGVLGGDLDGEVAFESAGTGRGCR